MAEKYKPLRLSKRILDRVLDRFIEDPEYVESLMQGLENAGLKNARYTGFKSGTYQAFKDSPKKAALMCLLAGFALGWETYRESFGKKKEEELECLHRAQSAWLPKPQKKKKGGVRGS